MQISPEAITLVQEAHAGKLSDDKLAKALLAAMTGRVVLIGDRVLAKSSSNPNQDLAFTLDETCSCAYARLGAPCVHEIAAALLVTQHQLDIRFYAERVKYVPFQGKRAPRKHIDYTGKPVAEQVIDKGQALAELFND